MSAVAPPPVIFVCGRNAVRSPMAEALWRGAFGPGARVASCGVEPAAYADGFMLAVMAEAGYDLSVHEPRDMAGLDAIEPELVIGLAEEAEEAARRIARQNETRLETWPVSDPTVVSGGREDQLAAYRKVRDAIAQRIEAYRADAGV